MLSNLSQMLGIIILPGARGIPIIIPTSTNYSLGGGAMTLPCVLGALIVGVVWLAITVALLFKDWDQPKKTNGIIALVNLGILAFVTISALVFSPHNLVPDNVWGGIVIGSWIGGGIATIISGGFYFMTDPD